MGEFKLEEALKVFQFSISFMIENLLTLQVTVKKLILLSENHNYQKALGYTEPVSLTCSVYLFEMIQKATYNSLQIYDLPRRATW